MLRILLVVPLAEEFDEVKRIFSVGTSEVRDGEFLYALASPPGTDIVGVVLGESGPTPAAQRTERLIALVRPNLIVVIGIAGSLTDDAELADVVVADEIDHYLADSKAIPSETGSFRFATSGRHARTSYSILQAVRNFKYAAQGLYDAWRAECRLRTSEPDPDVLIGHVACGDSVGDSKEFVSFLKGDCDRKYVALEMESSGVAEAASARAFPVPLLIVRGISDHSAGKQDLDASSHGKWRRAAAGNAASYVQHLLGWPTFTELVSPEQSQLGHEAHVADVADFIKKTR